MGRLFSNRVRISHLFQFALVVADHRRRRRWGAGAAQSGSCLSQRPTCIETNIDFSQIYIDRKSKTLKAKREISSETEDGILKFQKIEYQHINAPIQQSADGWSKSKSCTEDFTQAAQRTEWQNRLKCVRLQANGHQA